MLYLTPLFPEGTYILKHGSRRQSIYKGNRILLSRITIAQFNNAFKIGVLRKIKIDKPNSKTPDPAKYIPYELDRRAVRALHGKSKLKKAYLQYYKTGQLPGQDIKPAIETPAKDPGPLFSQPVRIKNSRTEISQTAMEEILRSPFCREQICLFFECTDRTVRNWISSSDPMLTTPDAVEIITKTTGLSIDKILIKKSI